MWIKDKGRLKNPALKTKRDYLSNLEIEIMFDKKFISFICQDEDDLSEENESSEEKLEESEPGTDEDLVEDDSPGDETEE